MQRRIPKIQSITVTQLLLKFFDSVVTNGLYDLFKLYINCIFGKDVVNMYVLSTIFVVYLLLTFAGGSARKHYSSEKLTSTSNRLLL